MRSTGVRRLAPPRAKAPGQQDHLIVGLMVLVAVMLIMLTAAAQSWTVLLRRDREAELIFRGEQYAKAIAFYQKEHNAYPLQLDLLLKKGPHGHRYIRQLFEDPLADDGKWGELYLSPTGKGYINPYATQLNPLDPFGNNPAVGDSGLPGTGRKKGEKKPGYSEMNRSEFEKLGGQNLPIVGVVHKEEEFGYKIYVGTASINDWAFTMLAEGQEMNPGGAGGVKPLVGRERSLGVGDPTAPIILPGMRDLDEEEAKSIREQVREIQREREEEKRREEEEEQQRREEEAQEQDEYDDEDPDAPDDDPNAPYDDDPNAPYDDDPNAPYDDDPNG